MTLTLKFQGQIWNNLISGIGGPIDIGWKEYESAIYTHEHDCWVAMVGQVDVLFSDWSDFRLAIDISGVIRLNFFIHLLSFSKDE